MSAVAGLRIAHEHGVHVGVDGADLVLDANREPPATVLEAIRLYKPDIVVLLGDQHDNWSASDWQAHFDERAGIREYDGGKSREEAEYLASSRMLDGLVSPPAGAGEDCAVRFRHPVHQLL